ncbi:MAG: hypothetical protein LBD14_05840 [Puniceicoccales bacterium]|nr:hypothetical protein [Puniceicoccales bacterium]
MTTRSFFRSSGCEIQLNELSPEVSFYKNIPIFWFLLSAIALFLSIFFIVCIWVSRGRDLSSALMSATMVLFLGGGLAFLSGREALRRNVNYIIFHWKNAGHPAVCLRKNIPSEIHVKEFVEIIKEKICSFQTKQET